MNIYSFILEIAITTWVFVYCRDGKHDRTRPHRRKQSALSTVQSAEFGEKFHSSFFNDAQTDRRHTARQMEGRADTSEHGDDSLMNASHTVDSSLKHLLC